MGDVASVRKRPGMYVGSIGEAGVLSLLLEAVANAYDQYLAAHCSRIHLAIAADGTIEVTDNGRGIPAASLRTWLGSLSNEPTVDGHRPYSHLGSRRRKSDAELVVATVSVVLADVLWGNPTKDRLDSPYAREPVATATRTALDRWARTHSAELEGLRYRRSRRAEYWQHSSDPEWFRTGSATPARKR